MPGTVFRISFLVALLGVGVYWFYLWHGGPAIAALDAQVSGFEFTGRTAVTLEPEMGPMRIELEARTGTEEGSDRDFGYQVQVLRGEEPIWWRSDDVTWTDLHPPSGGLPTGGSRTNVQSRRAPQRLITLPLGEFTVPAPDRYEISVLVWRDAPGHHDLRFVLRRRGGDPDLRFVLLLGGVPFLLGLVGYRVLRSRGW